MTMSNQPVYDSSAFSLVLPSRVVPVIPHQSHAKSRQPQSQHHAVQSPTAEMITNLISSQHPAEAGITNLGHSSISASMAAGEHYQCDAGGLSLPAYNNMAAMSVPVEAQVHEPYLQAASEYQQNITGDNMSNFSRRQVNSTMGILSAERFDDGVAASRSIIRSQRGGQQRSPKAVYGLSLEDDLQRGSARARNQAERHQRPQSVERTGGDRRRKKQKISEDEDGEDDASKKARGRPRLDTKDETAADVGY